MTWCLRPCRRYLPHRRGVAPGERHDGGEEGRVEVAVVAEVGSASGSSERTARAESAAASASPAAPVPETELEDA
ncbi:hypothetical protein C2845_PM01G09030 [Panicum miliaceum]|uniref:Uncharacterized protein n=1 Tax=Panicum miliaceum TaxID=4540 RepID=A0A3L6TFE6_PANMI|nr:hypothetical protein C2845_PM01G09030 [Panicum miliaceum]